MNANEGQKRTIVGIATHMFEKRGKPMTYTKMVRYIGHIYYRRKNISKRDENSIGGTLVDARQAGIFKSKKVGNDTMWGLANWDDVMFHNDIEGNQRIVEFAIRKKGFSGMPTILDRGTLGEIAYRYFSRNVQGNPLYDVVEIVGEVKRIVGRNELDSALQNMIR